MFKKFYGVIVQTRNFELTNVVGSMQIAVEFFNIWEADELSIINVSRADNNFDQFIQNIRDASKFSFLPITVGGWINSIERVKKCFMNGADKIMVNTKLFNDQKFASKIIKQFGSQALVASIDAKYKDGEHLVHIDRGRISTGISAVIWAKELEQIGVGEIFLVSIDQDGMKNGYDLELMKAVSDSVKIPVIAFGGVHDFNDMVICFKNTKIDAVSAGNVFHYFEQSTRIAKNILIENDIYTRIPNNYNEY